MRTLILLSSCLCAGVAFAQEPTVDDLVYRALSVRHPEPACADVEALTPTPVPTLLKMVEEVTQPPWVGMRAASCLIDRHHGEIGDRLDRWVTDPELRGLGILVINKLDALPLDVATALATRAVAAGPDPDDTRARLQRSRTPELRVVGGAK